MSLTGRVHCSENMTIVISRAYLNSLGYDGSSVYLNEPLCRPQVSRYEVTFVFPIDACGNIKTVDILHPFREFQLFSVGLSLILKIYHGQFEDGRAVYTNTLRAYPSTSGEITRQDHLKLFVGCKMYQDSVSQIMYLIKHRDNSSITGTGRFTTSMHFYTSSSFRYKVWNSRVHAL